MALSISQSARNYTMYPELPLKLVLPATSVANNMLVLFVFGNRTNYGFNISQETAETPDPIVADDQGNTWTRRQKLVNLCLEESTSPPQSPPVISPDASGYYPSFYLFTASVATGKTSAIPTVSIYDAGLSGAITSPPLSWSPPIVYGRPVFDGGIRAVLMEITGSGSRTYDKSSTIITDSATPGAALITPSAGNEMVIEACALIDSSAIGLGAASLSPPLAATYQHSSNFTSGSTYFLIQSTVEGSSALASLGFSNPIGYAAGVISVAIA